MTLENDDFFNLLEQCGFNELTAEKYPDSYNAIQVTGYNPYKTRRIFRHNNIDVKFDFACFMIYKDGKLILSQLAFKSFKKYAKIPARAINFIRFKKPHRDAISQKIRRLLLNKTPYCINCGNTENLQIDHILAVSKGGTNHISNLQVLCDKCNLKKGNKPASILPYAFGNN